MVPQVGGSTVLPHLLINYVVLAVYKELQDLCPVMVKVRIAAVHRGLPELVKTV